MSSEAWQQLDLQTQEGLRWLAQRINSHFVRSGLWHPDVLPHHRFQTLANEVLKPDSRVLTQHASTDSMAPRIIAGPWSATTTKRSAPSTGLLVVETMPKPSRLDRLYWKIKDDPEFQHLREYAEFVPGEGPWPNPKAMLIGEAPGENEDRLQRPFVGQAGNFLDGVMWDAGLKRADVFVTNVIKYRPPNNRTPTQDEIEFAIPHLRKEVTTVLPEGGLIILLGAVPLNVVDYDMRIGKVHGEPFERGPWTFLPMYHPSYIMRNRKKMLPIYQRDWTKAKELLAA